MKNKNLIINISFTMILLCSFFLISVETVNATIRVEPARIIITALENKRNTGMIEVVNNSEEELELTALLNDWSLDERDELIVFNQGETEYSLDGLIKFNPKEFSIPPGKKQIVRFTISPPKGNNITKERRGVVFFEREMDYIDGATGSRVKSQIGTVIYYIPENIEYKFNFLGLRVYKTSSEVPQRIIINIKNNGEAHLRYYTSYKIINSNNELVMEDSLNELLILPKNERYFSFYLKDRLKPGNYKFMLEFSFHNTDQVAEYQIPIKIE